jgi:hypothetical protein
MAIARSAVPVKVIDCEAEYRHMQAEVAAGTQPSSTFSQLPLRRL